MHDSIGLRLSVDAEARVGSADRQTQAGRRTGQEMADAAPVLTDQRVRTTMMRVSALLGTLPPEAMVVSTIIEGWPPAARRW